MTADLFDIGANLADSSFDSDRDAVIERAVAVGVRRIIVTGTSVVSSHAAIGLARSRPGVLWATAGIHPHLARECDGASLAALRTLAGNPEVVAFGECGLDFHRDLSPRAIQERCFAEQLAIACELGLPVFVHDREAHPRVSALLREQRARLRDVVVHCFTGDRTALHDYLDLGAHIGITGWICDERRGTHLLDLVRDIPADRLMLETDAPYLLPRTIRPKRKSRRNEPAFLPWVLETVAAARRESPALVAQTTSVTATRFFGV